MDGKEVHPDMELKDLLKNERARKVLSKRGFACFKCSGLSKEKLRHAAQCHGIDVNELLRELLDGHNQKE